MASFLFPFLILDFATYVHIHVDTYAYICYCDVEDMYMHIKSHIKPEYYF